MLATALAVRDEDARCAARAVPPASVARLLAARRDPAEWRSGAGRELSATVVKSEQARRVGRAMKSAGPSGSCKFEVQPQYELRCDGSGATVRSSGTPLIFHKGLGLRKCVVRCCF